MKWWSSVRSWRWLELVLRWTRVLLSRTLKRSWSSDMRFRILMFSLVLRSWILRSLIRSHIIRWSPVSLIFSAISANSISLERMTIPAIISQRVWWDLYWSLPELRTRTRLIMRREVTSCGQRLGRWTLWLQKVRVRTGWFILWVSLSVLSRMRLMEWHSLVSLFLIIDIFWILD